MATHSSVLDWRIPGTGGAWWAAVCAVAQGQTRLKRLSSSSSSNRKEFTGFFLDTSRFGNDAPPNSWQGNERL